MWKNYLSRNQNTGCQGQHKAGEQIVMVMVMVVVVVVVVEVMMTMLKPTSSTGYEYRCSKQPKQK
jgi:hypothetical protein